MAGEETFAIDGIHVAVTRKRMKNLRLHVSPTGEVSVSAPHRVPVREIRRFVEGRTEWIRRRRQELADSPQAVAERAGEEEIAQWREAVQACVPPLVAEWEQVLGVKARTIAYRNMKSRWGSCQPATGRICINVRLALYPPECLEYVVVHELCHLLVSNHGPCFKGLLDRVMPDWRDRERKLR